MSMETHSKKRNRVYRRKFDHDEARHLRVVEGWSYERLCAHFGVTMHAMRRVCDAKFREKFDAKSKAYLMGGTCIRCGGPCSRYTYERDTYRRSGELCRKCWGETQQRRFRFDELGNLAAVRCATCKTWKDADLFPADNNSARNKHEQCRECGTKARQAYRERHKVPCVHCGAPCLPASEKGTNGGPEPRCRVCMIEHMRTPEFRAAARERSLKAIGAHATAD